MNSTIAHSTCRFTLTSQDVQALTELGWQQCNKSATPHVWDTHDTLLPEALMRQLSDLTATDTSEATPSNSTAHHHDDCRRRHTTWVVYDDCTHDDAAGLWFLMFVFLPCVCLVICCINYAYEQWKAFYTAVCCCRPVGTA